MEKAFAFGDKTIEPAVRRINAIKRIAVIGAGTMGQGIVVDLLRKTSYDVIVLDISSESLDRARDTLNRLWESDVRAARIRAEDVESLSNRVSYTQDYVALESADIIWEVATESDVIKAKIFAEIERVADVDQLAAVFSNTSSHTTAELAVLFTKEALRRKFLTVHGYFPFEANRLIDVMKGKFASDDTYQLGVVFADQILEKTVIALERDHHGYLTDPIFQGMGAILSWDIVSAADIVEMGDLWSMFTANPFSVLDQTGHMPYTESSRHLGDALPANDRLRSLYSRDGKYYPAWIEKLEKDGRIGANSPTRRGFYEWSDGSRSKPVAVLDPQSDSYVQIPAPSRTAYWSMYEAALQDERDGKVKSAASLIHVACASDVAGQQFRRYVLPICLYALDMIQDGFATPGQINIATRAGLRFKTGLIEFIDALIDHLGIDGLLELCRRARDENASDPYIAEMLDTEGTSGPRKNEPCFLHTMKKQNVQQLLEYGRYSSTPVGEVDVKAGTVRACYMDLKVYPPSAKDRVASIVFNSPMRGNVFNKAVIDQLEHAFKNVLAQHRKGTCGGVLFSAAGSGMKMFGADAREFNRGWFTRMKGYVPLTEEEAALSSTNAVGLFRTIQKSPVASLGVFGEKWGGGAEFSYFLDLRYDVRAFGFVYDTLDRTNLWTQKNVYNQPELDYAILPGFGGANEMKRIGMGDSIIFETFDQGLTADRAYQVGVSNGCFDDEFEALRRGYEQVRQMAKDAPYSRALFKHQLARDADDAILGIETGEVFNPAKNPFIDSGLLKLLDRAARPPKMNYCCNGVTLPGWCYPDP